MAAITQLTPLGIPWRRYGSFAGKTASAGGGPHDPGLITQLMPGGYPQRRYASFSGKAGTAAPVTEVRGGGWSWNRRLRPERPSVPDARRRYLKRVYKPEQIPEEARREIAVALAATLDMAVPPAGLPSAKAVADAAENATSSALGEIIMAVRKARRMKTDIDNAAAILLLL